MDNVSGRARHGNVERLGPSRMGSKWYICSSHISLYSPAFARSLPSQWRIAPLMYNLRWSKVLLQHHVHAPKHLCQEEEPSRLIQRTLLPLIPSLWSLQSEVTWWWSTWCGGSVCGGGEVRDERRWGGEGARGAHQLGARPADHCEGLDGGHCVGCGAGR